MFHPWQLHHPPELYDIDAYHVYFSKLHIALLHRQQSLLTSFHMTKPHSTLSHLHYVHDLV